MNGAMGAACHNVGSLVDTKGAGDEDSLVRLSQIYMTTFPASTILSSSG